MHCLTMYSVFSVLIGLLVFEGINALPTVQDFKITSHNKHPKNGRRMIHRDMRPNFRAAENTISKPTEKSDDKSIDKSIDKSCDKSNNTSSDKSEDKSLESVISAIDSGVKTFMDSQNKSEIIGNIAKYFRGLEQDKENKSVFRSKAEEYIKPELIHFRNDPDDKETVMLQFNSQSIINGLKELLHSDLVNKLMQHYSKEAAIVYRSIKTELDKPKRRHRHH